MWEYAEASRLLTIDCVASPECIFCKTPLYRFPPQKFEVENRVLLVQFSLCPTCGWWTVYHVLQGDHSRVKDFVESYGGNIGSLKELDLDDLTIPLKEVRQYLAAQQEKVYDLAPDRLEDVVASIFQDIGYQARVTGQRIPGKNGDDGIDVILDSSSGETVGVQVRRFKKKLRIEAEAIRSLAGALLIGGHTKGVFITTSSFRKGAIETAERFAAIGHPIELMDADRFFDALGIAQQKTVDITNEQINSYILMPAAHIGTGLLKEFVERENLFNRPIAAMSFTRDELVERDERGPITVVPPDADEGD